VSRKSVTRKSVRTTLTSWKGHKIMVLQKMAFACACPPLAYTIAY